MLRRRQFPSSAPSNESRRSEAEATLEALALTRGIVHRDAKPENVMVGDFDEEDRTSLGIVGTPSFMAP